MGVEDIFDDTAKTSGTVGSARLSNIVQSPKISLIISINGPSSSKDKHGLESCEPIQNGKAVKWSEKSLTRRCGEK